MDASTLKHCMELREVHIAHAAASSDAMLALLRRFAQIAKPGAGAPIIVAALARLGTTACEWIDGELRVEISGDANQTTIAITSSLGVGFSERVLPDTKLPVPFAEFVRGVALAPKLLEPLHLFESGRRIVLRASAELRRTTTPPPLVAIDPSCLVSIPRVTVPFDLDTPDHDPARGVR